MSNSGRQRDMVNLLREPRIVLPTVIVASIAIMIVGDLVTALAIFVFAVVLSYVIDCRMLVNLVKSVLPLMAVYTAMALLVQLLILGELDLEESLTTFLKFSSIAMISVSMFSRMYIPNLIKFFAKISPKLGFALALSVKMLKSFLKTWSEVLAVYKVNVPRGGYVDRFRVFMASVKVFAFLAMYAATQSAEALLTRSKIFRLASQS